jgi:protein involved in polysaccharide export with SLBB domain
VNIIVRTFASQKVFVGGEVNRPASVPLVSTLTAYDAILEAGGPKKSGSLSRVLLIRRGADGSPVVRAVNLNVTFKGGIPSLQPLVDLQPFDVLLVPERKISKIDRVVDEYIRQVIPVSLNGGFSYLFNPFQVATPK